MSSTLKIVLDPYRQGKPDYARITETYWTIDGPRSRLTDRCFPSIEAANAALTDLEANMPGNEEADKHVTAVLFRATDPNNRLGGRSLPAMTTMLYRICDDDQNKFDEACRLIGLFIEEAFRYEGSHKQENGVDP